ncbi:unnamed protein product [Aphanomyces euteiches]
MTNDHIRDLIALFAPDSLSVNRNELDQYDHLLASVVSQLVVQLTKSVKQQDLRETRPNQLLVVDDTKALHVGYPRVCYVSLERVLLPKRQPAIYRVPSISQSPQAQALLQRYAELLQDAPYDIPRALVLIRNLSVEHLFNIKPSSNLSPPRKAWVCTDAIISLLAACSPEFQKQVKQHSKRLHLSRIGTASLKDFLTLHHHSVIDRVPLPPIDYNVQPKPTFDSAYVLNQIAALPNPMDAWEQLNRILRRSLIDSIQEALACAVCAPSCGPTLLAQATGSPIATVADI